MEAESWIHLKLQAPGPCGAWRWVFGAMILTTSWPVVQQRCDELYCGDDDRIQDIRSRKSEDLPPFNFQDLWAPKCLLMLAGLLEGESARENWLHIERFVSTLWAKYLWFDSSELNSPGATPFLPLPYRPPRTRCCMSCQDSFWLRTKQCGGVAAWSKFTVKTWQQCFTLFVRSLAAEHWISSQRKQQIPFIIFSSMFCSFKCEKQMFKMLLFTVTLIPNLNCECQ